MYPIQHFSLGIIFTLILFFIFPQIGLIGFFLIVTSTVLIDVDHYLYYVFKKRDISLKNAYKWFIQRRKRFSQIFYFLHGVEVLIILFILGIFVSKYFLFVFMGFSFHLFLDTIYQIIQNERIDKFSLVYDFFKFRRLKFIDRKK